MNITYWKYGIDIAPESDTEEVYLETVLGLHKDGECAVAKRKGVGTLLYVRVGRKESRPRSARVPTRRATSVQCEGATERVPG